METSTSNPDFIVEVGEEYPYPSHVFAPNFVTVKLSGKNKYNVWKTQMLCLLSSHDMLGFINGKFVSPDENGKAKGIVRDMESWIRSDSLVKGWILGSLSEEAAMYVVDCLKKKLAKEDFTAKDAWDELQRIYGPAVRQQVAEEEVTGGAEGSSIPEDEKSEDKSKEKEITNKERVKNPKVVFFRHEMHKAILQGDIEAIIDLTDRGFSLTDGITKNGNTALHVAAGFSKNHKVLEKMLEWIPENTLVNVLNSDGSTPLHVAAITGNTEAAKILLGRNSDLLLAKDNEGHTPLAICLSNMHSEMSMFLLDHIKSLENKSSMFAGESGDELLVLAVSSKDFLLAGELLDEIGTIHSDAVLMAIAQNFPRELGFWERRCDIGDLDDRVFAFEDKYDKLVLSCGNQGAKIWHFFLFGIFAILLLFEIIPRIIVWPFVKERERIHMRAIDLLFGVFSKITIHIEFRNYHLYYTSSIFEATRQNACQVVVMIMSVFPDTIWSTDENGHNFIQYAVIHRSEKVYNILYRMNEHKNIYRTIKDSYGNNLLHLVARLAPANKLNLISGSALQIQRELQWYKEVEGFVCPLNRIQKNFSNETPKMLFTREHKELVIEGEKWMKTTAESYTITGALITTIVFAAAITVPGGNNDSGLPMFTNKTAFTIFAISDAISLFTAVTSLLMFLSILTARFAEQDFLIKLPTKLIIGLTTLFISTTTMIVAFGATLFLVFGDGNSWILIPIGALTCLPITSFVTLQFPLIVDLMRATYGRSIFVKKKSVYFY